MLASADNHRPELAAESGPANARIKASAKENTFNLGFEENGKYQFSGERTNNDGKYILVFDPARKAFVLHRIDSMFHMNVTRTPTASDPEALRKEFPHLTVSTFKKPPRPLPKKKPNPALVQPSAPPPKPSESDKAKPKPVALSLPTVSNSPPQPPPSAAAGASSDKDKKSKRAKTPESDEDDDDDDGGLLIEYPGGNPGSFRPPPPAFPPQITRRFSEFVRDNADEDEDEDVEQQDGGADADFEGYDEDDSNLNMFKLPSPVKYGGGSSGGQGQQAAETAGGDADADGDVDDFGDDLEAELEAAFEKLDEEESDVSEED